MNNPVEAKDFNVDDLFNNLPPEIETDIDLPSKGKFYSGKVKVRPVKFEDEKALASAKSSSINTKDILLSRCVEGVSPSDMLLIDKLAILIRLRAISYGQTYTAITICPACNEENELNINLLELPINQIPDNFTNPTEITLPITKKKVIVRLPTGADEDHIASQENLLENLWRFVMSVEGNPDKTVINKFLNHPKMPVRDIRAILNALAPEYGVSLKFKYKCSSCKTISVVDAPIGADFFSVNSDS